MHQVKRFKFSDFIKWLNGISVLNCYTQFSGKMNDDVSAKLKVVEGFVTIT